MRLAAVCVGAVTIALSSTALSQTMPPAYSGKTSWQISIFHEGEPNFVEPQGRAKIPATTDLAKRLDDRVGSSGEPVMPTSDADTVVADSLNVRFKLHPQQVVIQWRQANAEEWKTTARIADAEDVALREQLLRYPRFETAEFVEVSEYQGKDRVGAAAEMLVPRFFSHLSPMCEIPERHRQLILPPRMIDDLPFRNGDRYFLLRSVVSERDRYYQAYEYKGAIRSLIENAPPVPKSFSAEPDVNRRAMALVKYYFGYINDADPLVAGVSRLTVSGMGQVALLNTAPVLDEQILRNSVQNSDWNLQTRSAFALMLATRQRREDAPMIWELLRQSVSAQGRDHDFALAYALIVKDQAIDDLERVVPQSRADAYHWQETLRSLVNRCHEIPNTVSRARALRYLKSRLESGIDADQTIYGLQVWQAWDSTDDIVMHWDSPTSSCNRQIVTFLLACIDDSATGDTIRKEAKQALESFRKKATETVQSAEKYYLRNRPIKR